MVGAAARVSRRPRDVQPGAVAARAARGVCRGPRARSVPGAEPQAGRRSSPRPDVAFILENFFHAQRQRMIDVYPRYAELLAQRGRPPARRVRGAARASASTICATCRCGTSWRGSIRRISTATRASARSSRRAATSPRTTRRLLASDRARAAEPRDSRVPATRPRAGRSSCRRRRSTTRFCRCCATPTSTCGRIRSRGCRGIASMHPEDALEQLERAAACHERLFGRRPVGPVAVRRLGVRRDGAACRARPASSGWRPTS